jgi:hypothetical protein
VSTTFFPGSTLEATQPDVTLVSSDSVFFYVHSHVLSKSTNQLNSLLPTTDRELSSQMPVVSIPESSQILNILLHAVYNMQCTHYSPSYEHVSAAVDIISKYGFDIQAHCTPTTPLFNLLLGYAPVIPMDVYCLAGSHDLLELAIITSSYLLSFPLPTIDDDMADKMGSRYLRRLFFLHLGRADALKRLLLQPPVAHLPSPVCDASDQKRLTRAWALASAYIAWDARPSKPPEACRSSPYTDRSFADMTGPEIQTSLTPLADGLDCAQCKLSLRERISTLIAQWSAVKVRGYRSSRSKENRCADC